MIFITVGTQKFQFDRLFKKIDTLISEKVINEDVFAQIGNSLYIPKHFNYLKFTTSEQMTELYDKSTLIISHGGTSSIINALKMKKKVIVVPRLKKFNEHVDDHQMEICDKLQAAGYIMSVKNIDNLERVIEEIKNNNLKNFKFDNKSLLNSIEQNIEKFLKDN